MPSQSSVSSTTTFVSTAFAALLAPRRGRGVCIPRLVSSPTPAHNRVPVSQFLPSSFSTRTLLAPFRPQPAAERRGAHTSPIAQTAPKTPSKDASHPSSRRENCSSQSARPPQLQHQSATQLPAAARSTDDGGEDGENAIQSAFWLAAATELAAAISAIGLCLLSNLPVLGTNFCLSADAFSQSILVAVPFSLVFWVLEKFPTGVEHTTELHFRAFFESRPWSQIAIFCICVALGEELFFRAWLLPALTSLGCAPFLSVVLSALAFGVLHSYSALYMALATVAGFMFGSMYVFFASMLHPLFVHFAYDYVTILIFKSRWRQQSVK